MIEKLAKRLKFHYAWLILVMCSIFYAMTMGALVNCQGIFNTAIYQGMGWKYSEYCISTIFNGLSASVVLLFAAKIYNRYPVKFVLAVAMIIYGGGFGLRGAAHTIPGFCLVYTIIGIASAFILYIPVPMLLNAWFVKKKHLALSIAMMSSGLGGIAFNPVMEHFIETKGWRVASFLNGGLAVLITLPFILLFAVKKPEDIGLKPYGVGEESIENLPETGEAVSVEKDNKHTGKSFSRTMAATIVLAGIVSFVSFLPQQLSNYAVCRGFDPSVGAMMVSCAMAGNISSKLLIGAVVDRFGARKTYITDMLLVIGSIVVLLLNPNAPAVLYAASFVTGIVCANNVLVPPMAVETFSNADIYSTNLAKVNTATMLMSSVSIFAGGWLFDLVGDNSLLFATLIALQIICMVITVAIFKSSKKL